MDETRVYRAALTLWGADAQTLMAFEEMSELQKELCKHARGKDNRDAIAEEIADVEIMLEQMKILHGCVGLSAGHKEKKLERLAARCGFDVEPQDGQHMKFQGGRVLGPGVTFRMEKTSVSAPCDMPEGEEISLEDMIKKIVREMMAAWNEVNAACCVNISREEAAEIERLLQEAGPGTIVPMEEATVTGPCVVIDMPDGERITLNSAAEAYKLAGCIEEMAGRVWPEVAKE